MSAASNPTLVITAGDTFGYLFTILTPAGGNPSYSSPGATFELQNAPYLFAGATGLLTKTATPTQSGSVWSVQFNFAKADTLSIPPGVYAYQVEIVDGTNSQIVATGAIQITPNLIG